LRTEQPECKPSPWSITIVGCSSYACYATFSPITV
jgi:hypothetical protein